MCTTFLFGISSLTRLSLWFSFLLYSFVTGLYSAEIAHITQESASYGIVARLGLHLSKLCFSNLQFYRSLLFESMEVMPDHVHLFVKSNPIIPVHHIVSQFKGYSSRVLRDEFPWLRSRLPSLWTHSYYCETIGHISEETIRKYIEDQKKV